MPHVPLGASDNFKGKSSYGPYGDAIEEIDWSSGKILQTLKEVGLDKNTLVIYTSDNGPWIETTRGMKPDAEPFIPHDHSGLADPLRGWKMSAWDGGSRVPFIAWWPGKINGNRVSDELLTTMDLLPTMAKLAGAELPEYKIDGLEASSFLLGSSDSTPRDEYLFYSGCLLTGIRVDNWKLVLPRKANPEGTGWWGRMIEEVETIQLYDIQADPGETHDIAAKHPEVVEKLMRRIDKAKMELGDINITGAEVRSYSDNPRRLEANL
jgi:arylsulfatase